MPASAQTQVVKTSATWASDYGVRYVLPKTLLAFTVEYHSVQKTAGPYARYATRYLGIPENEITAEDCTEFVLDRITFVEEGVPDRDQSYLVQFRPKTTAPYVYLTETGLICTINAPFRAEEAAAPSSVPVPDGQADAVAPSLPSIYTEEYLHAGSAAKMAEVAAKNIYRIRESRQDLLTGETDNVPKDGEAMRIVLETLDAQEHQWMALFTGTTTTTSFSHRLTVEPSTETEDEILFRFSRHSGLVDADDLSGSPVYWRLRDLRTVEVAEPDPKRKAKEPQSIVYNIPGKAALEIYTAKEVLITTTANVTQFGTTGILATELLDDRKGPVQIYFYPHLGAIRQIIR
jgi:hypothetical protein